MQNHSLNAELKSVQQSLKNERQFKRDIIDALHDGIVIFNQRMSLEVMNQAAKQLLCFEPQHDEFFTDLEFFKNKKRTIKFNITRWLQQAIDQAQSAPKEILIWVRPNCSDHPSTPVLLSAKPILNNDQSFQALLLIIYDKTIVTHSDEQHRILEAAFNSYDGQFITNEKGYIIQPNFSFSAYTGLLPLELKTMTIIHWMQKQVTLKGNIQVEDILKSLLMEKKWSGEVQVHPNPETTFHAVLSLSMLIDDDKNIEHYVGTLQDITDIKESQANIERLAYYDELTGLPNRRLFMEHLDNSLLHHKRNHTYSAILYLDLDNFKEINDIYGHAIGDSAIQLTASKLAEILRAEDLVARISGDEFVILTQYNVISRTQAVQHALTLGSKIIQKLNQDYFIDEHQIPSSSSIGIHIIPGSEHDTPEQLVSCADLAMYEAKQRGKNQLYFYQTELTDKILRRREIEEALKHAHYDQEFYLVYQAQVSNHSEQISAETLIRWQHPVLGAIRPDQFISIAEETKQILKLGQWILRTAFNQVQQWNHQSQKPIHISINISPIQFHEATFVETILAIQHETQTNPKHITLELTEGILISNIEDALIKIKALAQLGYQLSIDDFGTGYSSLSYFQKLPIHELKIDQSFVAHIPGSKEDIAIIETIIQLANSKNLTIVAEGVETQEQVDFFKSHQSRILMQGFFFSHPERAEEFEKQFLSLPTTL
ncbi:MAG: EAL domain-containing protein [Thiotrichales bacterium]|nr:EAL domain-containing protein [Thiotrichales bacterium]